MTRSDFADGTNDLAGHLLRMEREAEAHVQHGRPDAAAGLYQLLLELVPNHTTALTFLGMRAFQSGDYRSSQTLMLRAVRARPDDAILRQNLAMTYQAGGDHQRALECFNDAVSLQPDFALCHFQIGRVLQDMGRLQDAVAAYREALRLDPGLRGAHRSPNAPPMVRDIARSAELAFEQHRRGLQKQAVQLALSGEDSPPPARLTQFLEQQFEQTEPEYAHPLQRPSFHFYPGLEPRPWYERDEFEWIPGFEAAFEDIRAELAAVLERQNGLEPYVEHSGYVPAEWRELSGSADWNAYHLMRGGKQLARHCAQCPETVAALKRTPLVRAQGHAPEAFFSILAPGAHIPPHVGLANTKLAVHLPLVIPDDCGIRVGGETRSWRPGECLIFDDSFEHEAWNDSGETRIVLIFEVWNPALTGVERRAIQALVKAADDFHRSFGRSTKPAAPPPAVETGS